MAADDVYEVQLHYQIGSQPTMNVIHLKEVESSTDDLPAQAVLDVVHALWDNSIVPWLSDEVTIPVLKARQILPIDGNSSILVPEGAEYNVLQGAVASEPLPSTVAALLSLQTATQGKRGQGRIYIPGYPESFSNAGRWVLASFQDVQTDAESILGIKSPGVGFTGTWRLAVYSRMDVTARPVIDLHLNSNFATQRGRRQHPGFA